MPQIKSDTRFVKVQVTLQELQGLLVNKAKAQGLIDFDPDRLQLYQNGEDAQGRAIYEIVFEKDNP